MDTLNKLVRANTPRFYKIKVPTPVACIADSRSSVSRPIRRGNEEA